MSKYVSWSREQRELAAKKNKSLVAVAVDSRPNKKGTVGHAEFIGVMSEAAVLKIWKYAMRVYQAEKKAGKKTT